MQSDKTISHLQYVHDRLCKRDSSLPNFWKFKEILRGFKIALGMKGNSRKVVWWESMYHNHF